MSSNPAAPDGGRRRAVKLSVEARRAQLLDCALTVFARKGIASAGHADVAAEAGVAVPTVFTYFPSRSSLVEAVVDAVEAYILGRADKAAALYDTVPDKLFSVLRDFADSLETDPVYATIWVNWGTSFQEEAWPSYERFVEGTIALHRDVIEAGLKRGEALGQVDPELSAFLFIGAATVIVQMSKQQRDAASIMRYVEVAMHGALHQV